MSTIAGIVNNGVVIPVSPLPEGAQVEIQVRTAAPTTAPQSANDLRRLPRAERQAALAAAAALAEADYLNDKDLTGFEAFIEEAICVGVP